MGKNLLRHLLVVDIEATCWRGRPPEGAVSDIIEIGVVPLDLRTLEVEEGLSIPVRPERSTIGPFCTELTGLTPADVEGAGSFEEACLVLREQLQSQRAIWASWGDYDRRHFERQCREMGVFYPFGPTHWNVKSLFALGQGLSFLVGMPRALKMLDLPLKGTHHRGLDDARNIARILQILLRRLRAGASQ